jgi:tetratricopeptide (TPR) repeat protein
MRRIRTSLLIPLLFAWPAAAQDFAALAQQAVQLQQSGNYAAAADAYRALLKLDPNQVPTHVNLAIVLVKLGRFDEAITEYQAADKLLPNDPRIALNLALAYEKSGRIEEAHRRFETLHDANPQETQVTFLLADCDLQLGDDARVIELLQPVAPEHPDDLGVAYMLGMALLRQHRVAEGQLLLDRILKHGDTAEARFLLATRMFESGDYPAAVKQFADAAELNPKLPRLQSFYGQALLNTGDPDGASAAFRRELEGNPTDFDANLGLAQILIVRKNATEALASAKRAQSMHPQDAAASLVLAQSLAALSRFEEARPYGEAVATTLAKSAEAHHTLADIYGGLHQRVRAAHELQLARTLDAAAQASSPGPKVAEIAPDFVLPRVGQSGSVSLRDFRGKSPVVLIFGSYSCPNFRDSAAALKSLQQRYGARLPFFLVYIREAHSTADWQSTRNARQDSSLARAVNMDEKQDHAAACSRKLHLPFPAVVDGMDNAVESAYAAWPSRAFVVGADGRILYSTRLTELDFEPAEMEAVLHKLVPTERR